MGEDERRHWELMTALGTIAQSLTRIARRLDGSPQRDRLRFSDLDAAKAERVKRDRHRERLTDSQELRYRLLLKRRGIEQ